MRINYKILISGALLTVFGLLALTALAQNDNPEISEPSPKLHLNIDQNGNMVVRGAEVTSVASSTIGAVTRWGAWNINWTVLTDSSTRFISRTGSLGSIAEIQVGHTINFDGKLVTGASQPTVQAKVVRNLSVRKLHIAPFGVIASIDRAAKKFVLKTGRPERDNITVQVLDTTTITKQGATTTFATLKIGDKVTAVGLWDETTNTLQAKQIKIQVTDQTTFQAGRLKTLTATTTPPTSIVVTFGRFDYTVNIAQDTSVLDRNWARASLANFRVGDHIRVFGAADGTTIDATVVRNVDLPRRR